MARQMRDEPWLKKWPGTMPGDEEPELISDSSESREPGRLARSNWANPDIF